MLTNWPKISLVTPCLNQAQFLEATIQSVLSQNYPNIEYIIIDGGSTDGSLEIIKKYESQVHFWCSEPDGGQYDAINKGFAHSTGEIMAWLNSDDMYFSWTFKTVGSIMSELLQVEWLTSLNPGLW
ncbi:MAG: glycosyltransferase, partial [Nostoc sp. C3-bin3]|nr:glycosyltransferase [Nostoc sp. C3-bin3]